MPCSCAILVGVRKMPVVCLVVVLVLSACGESKLEQQPMKSPVIKNTGGTPVWLELADHTCEQQTSLAALSKQASIFFWKPPQGKRLQVDLSAFSGSPLRGPALTGATIGATHLIKQNFVDERPSLSGGRPLYFCRADSHYPRRSLENVALAAAYGIQVGYQAYQNVRHELRAPRLPPVHLLVLPHTIEERQVGDRVVRRTMTDNAAWFKASDNPGYYIAVIPHSREKKHAGKFWEQPAVLVHEYGHHVYYRLAPKVHRTAASIDTPNSRPDHLGKLRLMHAMEEAFADLYAYYAFQSQAQALFSGRLHISEARDIEHPTLLQGLHGLVVSKTLDRKLLNHFLSPLATDQTSALPGLVLQDEHSMGAVLAYGLNLFYQATATQARLLGGEEEGRAKLRYLLRWAQSLNRRGDALRSWAPEASPSLLAELILLAVEASRERYEDDLPSLSIEQCQALAQAFPVYFDQWVYTNRLGECAAWH